MRILAFDTATDATTVALLDSASALAVEQRDDPPIGERPGHATRLLGLIADVLERSGGGWERVDRIAVGVGPGSFTGLRIGIATARALARARAGSCDLVGVSSLEALAAGALGQGAQPARPNAEGAEPTGADGHDAYPPDADLPGADPPAPVLAVIDARRGEVFAAAWLGDRILLEPATRRPEQLAAAIDTLRAGGAPAPLTVGDGALRFRQELELAGAVIPPADSRMHRISALNVCRIASGLGAVAPSEVRPDYLRAPDAKVPKGQRASKPPPTQAP